MKQYLLYIYDKIYNKSTPALIKKIADSILITCAFAGSGSIFFSTIIAQHPGIAVFIFWIGLIAKFALECCTEKENVKP